ncbi:MAG: hypothetical protein KDB27_16965 [Planctomycetales bacterium]|nr:hypothetical protein [Planctomycetales bacterium]
MSQAESPPPVRRSAAVMLVFVVTISVVGYLVGISDNFLRSTAVVPPLETSVHQHDASSADVSAEVLASDAIPAVAYSGMRRRETGPTSAWKPTLNRILSDTDYHRCITCHNPHTSEIMPSEEEKRRSLAVRATRRAFNGAPPVIPHAVERTDDAACYACHGEGALVGDRVANRMSHGLLVNCLQCHAAPPPKPFANVEAKVANGFSGLPAPVSAERAYPDAPPVIPHSTWMRDRCLSCHGGVAGWPGLEVSHRWRTNCLQCHATSATLEQSVVSDPVGYVPEFAVGP